MTDETTRTPLQVSMREAARLMGFSERTIARLARRRELTAVGRGRLRRITYASLLEYQRRETEGR
jgi:excisionase family DNA binding protein